MSTPPTFIVQRLNSAQVFFKCHKCGRRNIYGWPEGESEAIFGGHRASHCECWPNGYYIALEEVSQ